MVSRRYRRLLQRRLRRRPLLPFLLAATVAIDATIVFSGSNLGDILGDEFWRLFILGTVVGQIGLLGIWVASAWQGIVLRLGIAVLASQVIAIVLTDPFSSDQWMDVFAMSAVSLFLLAATISTAAASRLLAGCLNHQKSRFPLVFSVGTLLLLTTVVAVVIVIVKQGDWSFLVDYLTIAEIILEAMISAWIWFACRQSQLWDNIAGKIILFTIVILALVAPVHHIGQMAIILIWLLALRSRRMPPPPFQLRLLSAHEEAAPENPERPLERHQVAEIKEINVVV